ncbi:MAG: alpha/beta hydrolase [Ilumatobacteraceae bacterium]
MQAPSTVPIHKMTDIDAGGVPARLYKPNDDANLPLLVYYHGGGWVLGSVESHDSVCRAICMQTPCAVLSIEYRLAPEHPFPAPLVDCVNATRWAHLNAASLGCDPNRIAIGGDSAGGNIAAAIANMQVIPAAYQLLIYPVTDCHLGHSSHQENKDGPFLTHAGMKWFVHHYVSGTNTSLDDPRLSPLFESDANLAAAPPTCVITAEFDPLRDEGDAYAAKLASLGVPVSHIRFSGQFHGFVSLADFVDDGKAAISMSASLLRAAFNPPQLS